MAKQTMGTNMHNKDMQSGLQKTNERLFLLALETSDTDYYCEKLANIASNVTNIKQYFFE